MLALFAYFVATPVGAALALIHVAATMLWLVAATIVAVMGLGGLAFAYRRPMPDATS